MIANKGTLISWSTLYDGVRERGMRKSRFKNVSHGKGAEEGELAYLDESKH